MSWRMEKTRAELKAAWSALKLSWRKRNSWRDSAHFFADIFVECCRAAPYTTGHLIALYVAFKALEFVVIRLPH